ncbi:acyl-CoA dehydrogenase family protein [Alteromonas sp. M12]|uniref:acyl-CoA dehydrogenase family protein n=1 Tax=Alteromonas sp. M12 TaxID=3135644 RepID=UPI00319D9E78
MSNITSLILNPLSTYGDAVTQVEAYYANVREKLRTRVVQPNGKIDSQKIEKQQHCVHGFAWLACYKDALQATYNWADSLQQEDNFGYLEQLIIALAFAEYLSQIGAGISMSQDEVIRPRHFGAETEAFDLLASPSVKSIIDASLEHDFKLAIIEVISERGLVQGLGNDGLDETCDMVRDQFRRFTDEEVTPYASNWHDNNELIPEHIIQQMADLGVFGVTVPEEYGGMGMGIDVMCVITEELSRGYIGVGSLGTRTEIACELIKQGGTEQQKNHYLPKLASGEMLPTAVFTEPNTGSDLASLKTRAVKTDDVYQITGNKTWITHAARTDVMTMLVRTDLNEPGYKGLTMLIAEKPRGTEVEPFPAKGMSGGEIHVIGYRGMREYELGFDNFEVPLENALGGSEGNGFKQLMATFESARIQTAARAVGVAHNAFELGFNYANDREQFGKPILAFPRVYGKLAWMVAELTLVRQLTYRAARTKEAGQRTDVEAGMAKLLGARLAWSCADNALQIHGGNGYAVEYPISRVLCDARILNVFEGAAEIQAQVIARSLLA